MLIVNANSVDSDQMPRSGASDLGLHCLPMSHLWDARHKWVKRIHSETKNTNESEEHTNEKKIAELKFGDIL